VHEAGEALDHRVVGGLVRVRAIGPVAADRRVDQTRIVRGERGVTDAETVRDAGPEVLDHRIRTRRDPSRHRDAIRLLEIDHDRAFVAIELHPDRREPGAKRRTHAPRAVAARRLHLHHVRAEVAEHLCAERSRDHGGEIQHANACKRPARRRADLDLHCHKLLP
jgi:hypothetical protein